MPLANSASPRRAQRYPAVVVAGSPSQIKLTTAQRRIHRVFLTFMVNVTQKIGKSIRSDLTARIQVFAGLLALDAEIAGRGSWAVNDMIQAVGINWRSRYRVVEHDHRGGDAVEGAGPGGYTLPRRGGRVVECGGLENRYVGNPGVGGSNPPLSALYGWPAFQNAAALSGPRFSAGQLLPFEASPCRVRRSIAQGSRVLRWWRGSGATWLKC